MRKKENHCCSAVASGSVVTVWCTGCLCRVHVCVVCSLTRKHRRGQGRYSRIKNTYSIETVKDVKKTTIKKPKHAALRSVLIWRCMCVCANRSSEWGARSVFVSYCTWGQKWCSDAWIYFSTKICLSRFYGVNDVQGLIFILYCMWGVCMSVL